MTPSDHIGEIKKLPPTALEALTSDDASAEAFLRDLEDDDGPADGYQGENW